MAKKKLEIKTKGPKSLDTKMLEGVGTLIFNSLGVARRNYKEGVRESWVLTLG